LLDSLLQEKNDFVFKNFTQFFVNIKVFHCNVGRGYIPS